MAFMVLTTSEDALATGPSPRGGSPRAWSMEPAVFCSFSYSAHWLFRASISLGSPAYFSTD